MVWQNIVITLSLLIPIVSHNYAINIHSGIVRVFTFFVLFTRTWTTNLIVEKALVKIIAGDFNIYTAKEKRLLILAFARTLFC